MIILNQDPTCQVISDPDLDPEREKVSDPARIQIRNTDKKETIFLKGLQIR